MAGTIPGASAPTSSPTARAVRRKLHAMELDFLRNLVAELLVERDELAEECANLKRQLCDAEGRADMFHDALNRETAETGGTLGLTQAGQIVTLPGGSLQ